LRRGLLATLLPPSLTERLAVPEAYARTSHTLCKCDLQVDGAQMNADNDNNRDGVMTSSMLTLSSGQIVTRSRGAKSGSRPYTACQLMMLSEPLNLNYQIFRDRSQIRHATEDTVLAGAVWLRSKTITE
jgi:hypothetical protein